jgi:hypothetical protein
VEFVIEDKMIILSLLDRMHSILADGGRITDEVYETLVNDTESIYHDLMTDQIEEIEDQSASTQSVLEPKDSFWGKP